MIRKKRTKRELGALKTTKIFHAYLVEKENQNEIALKFKVLREPIHRLLQDFKKNN
jgi:DNA-binding transcriptional regulator LsrR (DeoR family)